MRLIVTAILLLSSWNLLAQDSTFANPPKHRIGFIYGFGNQDVLTVAYGYEVQYFKFHYYRSVYHLKGWMLEGVLMPQYNLTRFRPVDDLPEELDGYEFGLNVGALIRKNLIKDYLVFYTLGSSGPHYASGVPERQSSGFLFASKYSIGLNAKLTKSTYLDLSIGIRHISNAQLKLPNGGINDAGAIGGILINL